jgi:TorA maturation chaperone TorD
MNMTIDSASDALHASLQLTAALYRSPTAALRDELASGQVAALSDSLASALNLPAPALLIPDWPTVETSFVALFVTNQRGIIPPYAGYALDNELLGPSFEALMAFYQSHGFTLDGAFNDLPDHLSAVAEAALLLLEADRYDDALLLARRFLQPWFGRYADRVLSADGSGLYGPLTHFLRLALTRLTEVQDEVTA